MFGGWTSCASHKTHAQRGSQQVRPQASRCRQTRVTLKFYVLLITQALSISAVAAFDSQTSQFIDGELLHFGSSQVWNVPQLFCCRTFVELAYIVSQAPAGRPMDGYGAARPLQSGRLRLRAACANTVARLGYRCSRQR